MGLELVPVICLCVGVLLGTMLGRGRRGEPVNLIFTQSKRERFRYKYEHAITGRTVAVSPSSSTTYPEAVAKAPKRFRVVGTIDRTRPAA